MARRPAAGVVAMAGLVVATTTAIAVAAVPARARPRAEATHSQASPQEPPLTPQQVARGDSIFRGKVAGGTCFTCHQLNAKGLPGLAPDLTDAKWLHGDGGYDFIVATVLKGVPKPKQAGAPMLARGGTSMNDADIRAVAAYVYSLRKAKK